jgi:hypothetical protein
MRAFCLDGGLRGPTEHALYPPAGGRIKGRRSGEIRRAKALNHFPNEHVATKSRSVEERDSSASAAPGQREEFTF